MKYKNKFTVEGEPELLEAFENKLKSIGYRVYNRFSDSTKAIYVNGWKSAVDLKQYEGTTFANQDSNGSFKILLLPRDWNEAIELAKEIEKEIPEYVKLLKGWSVDDEFLGEIFELSTLDNLKKFREGGTKESFRMNITNWLISKCFEASTKEAFEKQETDRKNKFKVGDFCTFEGKLFYIESIDKYFNYSIQVPGSNSSYKIGELSSFQKNSKIYNDSIVISDEEALAMLIEYYAKQGVVEEVKISGGGSSSHGITGFELVKNQTESKKNCKSVDYGKSQLAIFVGSGEYYMTPTMKNFKIEPKELFVSGYRVEIVNMPWMATFPTKLAKIGCEYATKESLVLIRDMIKANTDYSYKLLHSKHGNIILDAEELNEVIKLLEN